MAFLYRFNALAIGDLQESNSVLKILYAAISKLICLTKKLIGVL